MLKKQLEAQDNMAKNKENIVNEEVSEEVKNRFMTYFLLFFPTVILIAIPGTINDSLSLAISLKVLIAFYSFVTLKTFVDKHYE